MMARRAFWPATWRVEEWRKSAGIRNLEIWGLGSNGTENRLKGLMAIHHLVHLPTSEAAIPPVLPIPGVQTRSGQGS